jgi:NAD(P)-dependent dehydrogenase (short-subunit alcohol dehydrogenase family)
MGRLECEVAVITGANSGIGLATAKRFAEEGARVFMTGRRQAELDAAVREVGRGARGVEGDISNLGDLDRLFAIVRQEAGTIDVLFANAGGGEFKPLPEIWCQELAPRRIRVSVLTPGSTSTPGWHASATSAAQLQAMEAFVKATTPLGRLADPAEVAGAALFLASDDSSFVTGSEVCVDGGSAQI